MAGKKKEQVKIDPKRKVYTRPAARNTIEPQSREPKRRPSPVDNYDVYTIQPKKSQGQSTQNERFRDRSHRPSYDIHGQSTDTDDSDEEFAPFPSRAVPKTARIYPENVISLVETKVADAIAVFEIVALTHPNHGLCPVVELRGALELVALTRPNHGLRPVVEPRAALAITAIEAEVLATTQSLDFSHKTPFMDPMFPSSGGFESFTSSYTSPNGHQSYTTNTFGGSSPFNQPFFPGGSTPRTPRNKTAFFTDRPRRTSQYDPFPQNTPNAHGSPWDGGVMDDLLRAGHEHIDRSIENAQRRMQQEKAREAREREREPRYEWTGRNHNHHDQTPRYDHKHNDNKHSRDHAQDHNDSSSHHHNDYERFQRQRDRARSRARSQARNHKHEHDPRAPSPVKEDASSSQHDYYATLGITPTATLEEVRAAAKKRRIATHPDKCKKPGMTEAQIKEIDEEAKRVGEAAVCLSDKNARARYDYEHHATKRFGGMRM
ncbi:MAG: hypothetical protein OHK93_007161 [Ramalina farinacea]|uniref:J domain-containing protein n=1 Tax=Ramalina farinacea TaxID=258253 RepID=A0AA43QJY5_9LECA|nr:hypothetical protein [Ramalina farinacea]